MDTKTKNVVNVVVVRDSHYNGNTCVNLVTFGSFVWHVVMLECLLMNVGTHGIALQLCLRWRGHGSQSNGGAKDRFGMFAALKLLLWFAEPPLEPPTSATLAFFT